MLHQILKFACFTFKKIIIDNFFFFFRFLYKTFQQALSFSDPDVVIYLGDLLDEGNIATTEQYNRYIQRFHSIFLTPQYVKSVHIAGDNDIGGENGEYISNTNIRRFEIEFMKDDILDLKDQIRFFKINRMALDISNPDIEHNSKRIRVGLSHMPILQPGGPLQRNVISGIDPHILFTAHWHDSRIFIYPSTNSILFQENIIKEFDLQTLKNDKSYIEIMIPTSSYRMGKLLVGYGFATLESDIIDNKLFLQFSVYWSPPRFWYLKMYFVWIVVLSIYCVSRKCFNGLSSRTGMRAYFQY